MRPYDPAITAFCAAGPGRATGAGPRATPALSVTPDSRPDPAMGPARAPATFGYSAPDRVASSRSSMKIAASLSPAIRS
jgi:hypothetical protein